jgi:hypothetical protein
MKDIILRMISYKKLKKEELKDLPKIYKYTTETDFGYILKLIDNSNPEGKSFLEFGDYSKVNQLEVLYPKPQIGSKYCVRVNHK